MFAVRSRFAPAAAAALGCVTCKLDVDCDSRNPSLGGEGKAQGILYRPPSHLQDFCDLPPPDARCDSYYKLQVLHNDELKHHSISSSGNSGLMSVTKPSLMYVDICHKAGEQPTLALRRPGIFDKLAFERGEVRAAIVTCGGLSPGLNNVVRSIVNTLHDYGVNAVYGVKYGYAGFYSKPLELLDSMKLQNVHTQGGTCIGSSRGGFDLDKIINSLISKGINQVYIIGGDGTHRGANRLHEEIQKRGLKIAVVGIPKTIDNDIAYIDRSFGFLTAIEEAANVVKCAVVEARSHENGVAVLKLMGRDSGFIAAFTALSARNVDLCLIPEVSFSLEGPQSIYKHLEQRISQKGHAVVVVAEGAGQKLVEDGKQETDASGNIRKKDFCSFLCDEIKDHFKSQKLPLTLKFIDPSYQIRSVAANAEDSYLCMLLGSGAVHSAMAGFCGFSVGLINNRTALIPMSMIINDSPRFLNPHGRTWGRVIATTKQPDPFYRYVEHTHVD